MTDKLKNLYNNSEPALIDLAILTQKEYLAPDINTPYISQIHLEESLVMAALREQNLSVGRLSWDDASQDWSQCRALLFRSTWDYYHRYGEFAPWLSKVSGLTRLLNSAEILRWNIDKHYLADVAGQGVRIVPTQFLARGSAVNLANLMRQNDWRDAIIKPAISGGARLTFRVSSNNLDDVKTQLNSCLQNEDMMLQPFIDSVLSDGELSLIVIDGQCTHAVRKVPKAGDFRVQDDHGGVVMGHNASDEERAFAEQAVAACPQMPLYARVDVVRDGSGQLCLMELELIEPELFLRFFTPAAQRLAQAIARHLSI